jgi:hypothetical protein
MAAGAAIYVVPFLVGGGGLGARYVPTLIAIYLFAASIAAIAVGAGLALAQRRVGVQLMLFAALFQVGVLIGGQVTLWLATSGSNV